MMNEPGSSPMMQRIILNIEAVFSRGDLDKTPCRLYAQSIINWRYY